MKLRLARTFDAKEWSDLVTRFDGNIFHSIELAEVERCNGLRPLFFTFVEADAPIGIALGLLSERRFPLSLISKRIRLDTFPCIRNHDLDLLFETIREIRDYARRSGALSLEMNSYDSPIPVGNLEDLGFALKPRIEFVFDLTKTEKELWNSMKSSRRGYIRKAQSNEIALDSLRTVDALRKLSDLSGQSMARHGREGVSLKAVLSMKHLLDIGLAEIFVATHHGEVVSAIMVTEYNGKCYSIHSGNSAAGTKIGVPSLLRWHSVLELKRRGFIKYTIGGVPASAENDGDPQHGLYVFKREFGADARYCQSGSIQNMSTSRTKLAGALRRLRG